MVEALVNFFRNIIPGELTVFILSMTVSYTHLTLPTKLEV